MSQVSESLPHETHKKPYFVPFLAIALLAAAFGISLIFQDQSPIVTSLQPRVGTPGEVMVIDGNFFGPDPTSAWVSIGGQRVTASSILEWTAQRISLRIPQETRSGSVVVQTPSGRSKALSFTSQTQIPRIVQEVSSEIAAEIREFSPSECYPGDTIVLRGRNFGHMGSSLSLLVDSLPVLTDDIEFWSSHEIRFWMPMSTTSGIIQLRDNTGLSNSVHIPLMHAGVSVRAGTKAHDYRIEMSYQLRDIAVQKKPNWGSISVYLPIPPQFLGQSAQVLKTSGADLVAQTGLVQVFSVRQPSPEVNYRVFSQWDVQSSGSRISSGPDPETRYEKYREQQSRFATPSPLVPSKEASVKAFAVLAIGAETKPLTQARLLYHAVLSFLEVDIDAGLAFAPEALQDRKANSFGYANLLTGLMRSVGIPARLIEGVIYLDGAAPRSHYWLEFFIPTLGWVQADPALGDGLETGLAPAGLDPKTWYFGNIDERHIALIRGEGATGLTRLDSNIQKLFQRFVLMQVHGESSGYVESYGLFIDTPQVRRIH